MNVQAHTKKLISRSVLLNKENRAFLTANVDTLSSRKLDELAVLLESEKGDVEKGLEQVFASSDGKEHFRSAREKLRILKKQFMSDAEKEESTFSEHSLQDFDVA